MKNRAFKILIAAALVASVSLGLLGPERTVQAQDESAVSQPDPGQFARGAQTWADNCARCHNMRDPKELRDDQWRTVVSHMRVRAGLTGQEARDILAFLQGSN